MGEKAPQEIRERVWVEKFDHSGDMPRLIETVFVEQIIKPDEETQPQATRVVTTEEHQ